MKKIIFMMSMVSILMLSHVIANAIGIKISISSKAYWDGTGCKPRDKGGCVHIEASVPLGLGIIKGTLENTNGKLSIILDKETGITTKDFSTMFVNGKFTIGGELTFQKEVLRKIGYEGNPTFPERAYPYIERGSSITIYLN